MKTNLGNVVRTYDIERTICDVIKNKEKMDIQVFTYALKEYVKRNDKDLVKLITYSKILKIEAKQLIKMEVELLVLIDYSLYISEEEFNKYKNNLKNIWKKNLSLFNFT